MIDLKFLRENPDVVKQNIKNKFQDEKLKLVDEVIELDAENRKVQLEADNLRDLQNKLIPILGVGEDAILDPLWDNDKKVWRTNWIVTTPFGKMRVREGYVEKIV